MMPPAAVSPVPIKTHPPTQVKPPIIKKFVLIFIAILVLLSLGSAAYYWFFYKKTLSGQVKTTDKNTQSASTTLSLTNNLPQFALFNEEQITINPSIPKYTINKDSLINLGAVQKAGGKPTEKQIQLLVNPGFFITPAENKLADGEKILDVNLDFVDEFLMNYNEISGGWSEYERKPENTVFITSDLLLHTFHVFLERTFEYIEQQELQPKLLSLTNIIFDYSLKEFNETADPKQKASFERLIAFFLVPKVILETTAPQQETAPSNPQQETDSLKSDESVDSDQKIMEKLENYRSQVPASSWNNAQQEIKLIQEAKGASMSPLFGQYKKGEMDDYSQYKPRSHYAKNSVLRSYWKAMIWYGRNGFLTKSDELTLDALNQTLMLDNEALSLWENIYLPTVFFTGKSDDLTVYDYQKLIIEIYGTNAGFNDLTNQEKFSQFKEAVKKLNGPAIQSSIVMIETDKPDKQEVLEETKSFRFMGQRFTPDSFIFSELTQGDEAPDPQTGQKLPPIPTALMPMNIFGSSRAQTHLQTWINQNAPDSDKVLANKINKLDETFGKLTVNDWTQNLYWSWIYTLRSLFQNYGDGYPMFMQNEKWNDKDLYASLGSWTELRHDTLLYAKQSYAELGAGGEPEEKPAVPKGYVEPNLLFLNRIIGLLQMTIDGLKNNNILPEQQEYKAKQLLESFEFYRELAKKELQNEKISDEDFEKLRLSAIMLNQSLTPPTGSMMKASQARAGLIADVHTAVTSKVQEILYESTGIPNIIYVAVSDTNGTRLTRGVTYSYYEFTLPFGERLNDQDWQANIYENKQNFPTPQIPDWVKPLEK